MAAASTSNMKTCCVNYEAGTNCFSDPRIDCPHLASTVKQTQAKAAHAAQTIGDIASIVDAAQKDFLEEIIVLCETIGYMVGIAERGTGSKCPDDMRPEVFLLNYVRCLEAHQVGEEMMRAIELVASHKSSDWPERCQQMVDVVRAALGGDQQVALRLRLMASLSCPYDHHNQMAALRARKGASHE